MSLKRYFNIGDILYYVKEGDVISMKINRSGETITSNSYNVKASDVTTID